jgi:hypothetical protein
MSDTTQTAPRSRPRLRRRVLTAAAVLPGAFVFVHIVVFVAHTIEYMAAALFGHLI